MREAAVRERTGRAGGGSVVPLRQGGSVRRSVLATHGAPVVCKRATIARIEASAIELFANLGYEGTSLRDIATRAEVSLSAIDRHFGTKLDLFAEVHRRIWNDINLERTALMREATALNPQGCPTLEGVLRALILPIVRRARGSARQVAVVRLLRECDAMRVHHGLGCGPAPSILADRWITSIMHACPGLGRRKAVWAFSFVAGTILSGQLLDGWLDELMPESGDRSVEALAALTTDFCRAGIHAMAA